jgi:hypothetical protein
MSWWQWLILVPLLIAVVIFWLWGLVDVIVRRDLGGGGKALWVVPMLLLPGFVTLVYVLIGRRGREGATEAAGAP